MLRSLENLESEEYQALKFVLASAFHAILLATRTDHNTSRSAIALAEYADCNAIAFLDRQCITHPDERS